MTPRLATSVLVSALVRKAEAEGGFAAILSKGDPTAGAVIVVLTEKGKNSKAYERTLRPDGAYAWEKSAQDENHYTRHVPQLIARRRRFDPDLWVVELDIPSIERFAAGMNGLD